jgi:predicted ester cyclase
MKKALSAISSFLLLCFAFGCQSQMREETPAAVAEAMAQAIAQKYVDARNTVNLALLDEIYDPGVVVHDCSAPEDLVGLDALKAYYSNTHEAIPDLHAVIDETMVDGDKIIFVWTFSGTQSGVFRTPLGDIPPTGKKVAFSGVAIDRLVEGKVVEEWVYFNVLDFLLQLGFSVVPPQPALP